MEISQLKGIQAVSTQKPDDIDGNFNTCVFKEFTGGDQIICRPLYKGQFDFKLQFKAILCCNGSHKL